MHSLESILVNFNEDIHTELVVLQERLEADGLTQTDVYRQTTEVLALANAILDYAVNEDLVID